MSESDGGQVENESKYLRFGYGNIGYVLDRKETATVRYNLNRHFEEGEWIQARTPGNNVFAYIEIEEVWQCPLRLAYHDITRTDGRAHPAKDSHDLRKRLEDHYDTDLHPDDEVTVVYFDLVQTGPARRNATQRRDAIL